MTCRMSCLIKLAAAALLASVLCFTGRCIQAFETLGVGTGALLGGDLTDPEDDPMRGGERLLHSGPVNLPRPAFRYLERPRLVLHEPIRMGHALIGSHGEV